VNLISLENFQLSLARINLPRGPFSEKVNEEEKGNYKFLCSYSLTKKFDKNIFIRKEEPKNDD
jgi:hypothetical protein